MFSLVLDGALSQMIPQDHSEKISCSLKIFLKELTYNVKDFFFFPKFVFLLVVEKVRGDYRLSRFSVIIRCFLFTLFTIFFSFLVRDHKNILLNTFSPVLSKFLLPRLRQNRTRRLYIGLSSFL